MPLFSVPYSEEVIPGNIILRQKGNKCTYFLFWEAVTHLTIFAGYPGENVAEGRDYTLFATAPGYVYFTNDSLRGRRYINVVSKDRYDVLTKLKLLDRARRAAENRDKIWPFMLKDKESALRLTGKAAMPATPASSSKAQKATAATTAR